LALVVFFIRICWQYNKYSNSEAAGEPSAAATAAAAADAAAAAATDAVERQRRPSRLGSFKEIIQFVDKKEEEIKRTMKRRLSDKDNQAAGSSDKDNQAAGSSDAHSVPSA
jgi:ionotropic glutamate receptor